VVSIKARPHNARPTSVLAYIGLSPPKRVV
jgi:hypothetical protein